MKAAINGRVLIIDGVEKAERNVLPLLNNLLENNEMQLDDGRHLVAPERYDQLLEVSRTWFTWKSRQGQGSGLDGIMWGSCGGVIYNSWATAHT